MTERVEEIRRLSPWIQKGETPKEWAHRWGCSCRGSVSSECQVLRGALAQAEREREEDQERAARLATWLDETRAEVERLKDALEAAG